MNQRIFWRSCWALAKGWVSMLPALFPSIAFACMWLLEWMGVVPSGATFWVGFGLFVAAVVLVAGLLIYGYSRLVLYQQKDWIHGKDKPQ